MGIAGAKTLQKECPVLGEQEAVWHGEEQDITYRHYRGGIGAGGCVCRETRSISAIVTEFRWEMLGLSKEKIIVL